MSFNKKGELCVCEPPSDCEMENAPFACLAHSGRGLLDDVVVPLAGPESAAYRHVKKVWTIFLSPTGVIFFLNFPCFVLSFLKTFSKNLDLHHNIPRID